MVIGWRYPLLFMISCATQSKHKQDSRFLCTNSGGESCTWKSLTRLTLELQCRFLNVYTFTSVLCVCVCVFFQENVFTQISDLQLEEQFENFLDGSVLLLVCVLHTNVFSV